MNLFGINELGIISNVQCYPIEGGKKPLQNVLNPPVLIWNSK